MNSAIKWVVHWKSNKLALSWFVWCFSAFTVRVTAVNGRAMVHCSHGRRPKHKYTNTKPFQWPNQQRTIIDYYCAQFFWLYFFCSQSGCSAAASQTNEKNGICSDETNKNFYDDWHSKYFSSLALCNVNVRCKYVWFKHIICSMRGNCLRCG